MKSFAKFAIRNNTSNNPFSYNIPLPHKVHKTLGKMVVKIFQ